MPNTMKSMLFNLYFVGVIGKDGWLVELIAGPFANRNAADRALGEHKSMYVYRNTQLALCTTSSQFEIEQIE